MSLVSFTYSAYAPGSAVNDLVLSYWTLQVSATTPDELIYDMPADGCLNIMLVVENGDVSWAPLVGPRRESYPLAVRHDTQLLGVRFRPEMGASYLGRPAASLRDQVGRAHHWLGAEPIRQLSDRLLESTSADARSLVMDRWLFDSADRTEPPEQSVRDAVKAIVATEGNHQIATIATVCEVSTRHLQRCFKEAVGLTPKEYSLIRRANSLDKERLLEGTPDRLRTRLKPLLHPVS